MLDTVLDYWSYVVMAVLLVSAAIIDVRTGKIYNWLLYPAIITALVGHLLTGGWAGIHNAEVARMGMQDSIMGFIVGFVPLLLAFFAGGIGGGDAKLMGAVGALAGWRFALTSMVYGFAVTVLLAFIIMIKNGIARETLARVYRFMYLLVLRAGPASPSGKNSKKLPFGLALCIGSFVALVLTIMYGPNEKLFLLGL